MYREEHAFDIDIEDIIEVLFRNGAERGVPSDSSVREQNINVAFLLLHNRIKPVQVLEIRRIALHPSHIPPDLFHRCVQFGLAAAGDKYMSSFADEELSGGEPDAGTASGYDCYFTVEFVHGLCDARRGMKIRSFFAPRLPPAYIGRVSVIRYLALLVCVFSALQAADLKPQTIAAFDRYVKVTEDGFAKHQGFENFLWLDGHPKEKSMVWLQQSMVTPLKTLDQGVEIEVPDGDLQHWLGVIYLERSDTDADHLRGLLLNFAGYKDFFKQQIIESKIDKHEGDQYDFFLRLYRKQVSTVVLNVNETGKYTLIDPMRWWVACHSTHIGEAEHPKNKKTFDQERRAEEGAGYLWRLNIYWRVQQADNGVYVELEVITLARPTRGLINTSKLLTGFQTFPQDFTQYLIDTLEQIFMHHR